METAIHPGARTEVSSEGVEGSTGDIRKRVGVVGLGYWGTKLVRCFNELGVLTALYDINGDNLVRFSQRVTPVELKAPPWSIPAFSSSLGAFLKRVDAVAVATPPETHFEVAQEVLLSGKDVFIEKPITTKYEDAMALCRLAESSGRSLMVGHIYLHNGGIKRIPVPVGKAELYVQLLNERGGPSPSTREVFWAGMPHACSLAVHFFPDEPAVVEAGDLSGMRYRAKITYWNGSVAYLDVGDFTDRKLRRVELRMGNSRYVFDVSKPEGVSLLSGAQATSFGFGQDMKQHEPLMEECRAFLEFKGVDWMGPKVIKLMERIKAACSS